MQYYAGHRTSLPEHAHAQDAVIFEAGSIRYVAVGFSIHNDTKFIAGGNKAEFKAVYFTGVCFLGCGMGKKILASGIFDCIGNHSF